MMTDVYTRPVAAFTTRHPGRKIGTAITLAVLLNYSLLSVCHTLRRHTTAVELGVSLALQAILVALQLRHSLSTRTGLRPAPLPTLGLQAVLTLGPFLLFPESWTGMPGLLAGSTLIVLPALPAWTLFGLTVTLVEAILAVLGHTTGELAQTFAATVLTGLLVYGLSRMTQLVEGMSRLPETTERVVRAAAEQERLRMGRDLHDTLGYSLSVIALKGELAYRLVPERDRRARAEIREMVRASRQALADVRAVARGCLAMSLAAECRSANAVLRQAGIRSSVHVDPGALPAPIDSVLATVLREAVTNVLRHSQARRCRIVVARVGATVRLTVFNDGVREGGDLTADPGGGSGIGNLRSRLAEIDGRLMTVPLRPDCFVLSAEVPLPATARTATDPGTAATRRGRLSRGPRAGEAVVPA